MKKSLLIILIAVILLVILIAAGVVAWLVFGGQDSEKKAEEEEIDMSKTKIYVVDSDPIIANLDTQGEDSNRIIRVSVNLRLADDKILEEFNTNNSSLQIIDLIITILRNKTMEDVSKPEAKETIKQEIINAVNKNFNTDKVIDLYFDEFIVQ